MSYLHGKFFIIECSLKTLCSQVRKVSYLRVIVGVTLIGRTVEKNYREIIN